MKRKFRDITKDLNVIVEPKRKLVIVRPDYLYCDICFDKVYNYHTCRPPYVYCSRDCYEVLILSQINNYIDENKNNNDFMILDN